VVQPANPNQRIVPKRPNAPDPDNYLVSAVTQESDGPWIHLRGAVRVETVDLIFRADEADYNRDSGYLEARGHVQFENYVSGEKFAVDHATYNMEDHTGEFYSVSGSAPARIEARPGLLTTQNPFYFEGKWAEQLKDRYILHEGFLTDCLVPRPWWVLRARSFDVVPEDHAIAHHAWFYLRKVPLFYAPVFYKSLKKQPRRSGFLTPNIGNSSRRGKMVGVGYFWAINRSYDVSYRTQLFSQRGFAHNVDFRGEVNQKTSFDFTLYGVNDRGVEGQEPTPGVLITTAGHSEIGKGWQARGELNYLSSFAFRQNFTESFHEAIFSESNSVGYLTKHWSDYGFNLVAERNVVFQSTDPGNQIVLRKLPEIQFVAREHALRNWPFWFSLDSSYGLERRSQPLFQTRQFVERADFAPRVMTAWHWQGFSIAPSFGIRETFYDSSQATDRIVGDNLYRSSRDVTVDLILPSLARVFDGPKWMGQKVKHVIEPRATYRYVTGVDDFARTIRFDATDLLTNTNEVEFSLTNRLLSKDVNGTVSDLLSWELWYTRYFDPTFGGAVQPGIRNVTQSEVDLTGYAFLDGARRQSPVVSVLRSQHRWAGLEWRADYDPVRQAIVNSGVNAFSHFGKVTLSAGHYDLKTDPVLAPTANQFRGLISYGNENRRGWSYGFQAYYDYRKGLLQYSQTQVTYNTDCCGFSVQYHRFSIGSRNENQFRIAFAVSNIGSFGTLKRQEKIF
jgi:LPS-assembly protein